MSQISVHRFPNGLTVMIEPLPRPVVATSLSLPAGACVDPDGADGLASVLHSYVLRGAGERDTRSLAEAFETLGMNFDGGSERERTGLSLAGLAADWSEAIGLVADVILRPWLPAAEFEPCRQLALQELASLEDDPAHKHRLGLVGQHFPGPFGRTGFGTPEALEALTADVAREHWQRAYVPDGAVIAVAGGVDEAAVLDRLGELFGDWAGTPPVPPEPSAAGRSRYTHLSQETEQVQVGLVYDDVAPLDPARYEAGFAASVLSGGMGARLFTEVREKRGLCYSVRASAAAVKDHAVVIVQAGTTTERSSETLEVILSELARLPGTVTAEEVERARVRMLSATLMQEESTMARASRAAHDLHLYGRPVPTAEIRERVSAVTVDSVNAYLSAHPPGDYTVVTLGEQFTWPAGLRL